MPECTILLLEDEPLILMDLEMAAQDQGCHPITATTPEAALLALAEPNKQINIAVLDVSLGGGKTCLQVAQALNDAGIPYILHSGDLDRYDERVRSLGAQLVPKPTHSDEVIRIALGHIGERV